MQNDNICAIATPYGMGAISIIRCSGPDAIALVSKIFKGKNLNKVKSHTINYGFIYDKNGVVDEVLANVYIAPRSYDGENCVEINCHGGVFCTNKVLETLLVNGFRLAERGEFSKRAFLNHKIDLTEAESIMDIISATNDTALKSAENSLRSYTKRLITGFRDKLLDIIAKIEVNIDYPEYDDAVEVTHKYIKPIVSNLIDEINDIIKNSKIGSIAINGIKCVIVGKPNVGKSSILNLLLDEDKAIVSDEAGTTRDVIEGNVCLGDITLRLIDTAGVHESDNKVEKIGINKSIRLMEEADIILLVLDQSNEITEEDEILLESTKDKRRIIIGNKYDLGQKKIRDLDIINFSALNREGFEELVNRIREVTKVNEFNVDSTKYLSNIRHQTLIEEAKKSLESAIFGINGNIPIDLIEIDLKSAFDKLGEITGETCPDELITALFSKFCLGK